MPKKKGPQEAIVEDFVFYDFIEAKGSVGCKVRWRRDPRESMTNEQAEDTVMEILKDMGKWEAKQLLKRPNKAQKQGQQGEIGYSSYDPIVHFLSPEGDHKVLNLVFTLTQKERLRRGANQAKVPMEQDKPLKIDEILPQIQNIVKWRELQKAKKMLGK